MKRIVGAALFVGTLAFTVAGCGSDTKPLGCANACAQSGARQCSGNGYQVCGDVNGCLQWGAVTACDAGQSCAGGDCVTSCTDSCPTNGATECSGTDGYVECSDSNSDGCLEWSAKKDCPHGVSCANGTCASSCTNACTTAGAKQCADDKKGYMTCGNYNADPCLEWSAVTACAAHEKCDAGRCVPECVDECNPPGAKKCGRDTGGEGFAVCGNTNGDTCLEWGALSHCKAGEVCSNGACAATCTDECPTVGAKECTSPWPIAGARECVGPTSGHNCKSWQTTSCVPLLEMCDAGACVPYCSDECNPAGDTQCTGAGYQVCGAEAGSACLAWGPAVSCGSDKVCQDGGCVASSTCSDQCATAGLRQCAGSYGYRTCGNYNADPCLELSDVTYCSAYEVCNGGDCVANCTDECQWGTYGCDSGTAYWDCYDADGDGCLNKVVTYCDYGTICSGGWCQSGTCSDDSFAPNSTLADAGYVYDGTYSSLMLCSGTEDWYWTSLANGGDISVTVSFSTADGDLDLELYDTFGTLVDRSDGVSSSETVAWTANASGDVYVRVYRYSGGDVPYDMDVTITAPLACIDDTYAGNSFSYATDLASEIDAWGYATVSGLQICAGVEDWFKVYLFAGESLQASISFVNAVGDLDLYLANGSGTVIATSASTSNNSETASVVAASTGYYYVNVAGYGSAENAYTLSIAIGATCVDDRDEDNDTAGTATSLSLYVGDNNYYNLQVCAGDDDWYTFYLLEGDTLDATIYFSNSLGDLDLYLFDSDANQLASSATSADTEHVQYVAPAGGYYFVEVNGFQELAAAPYDMTLTVTPY